MLDVETQTAPASTRFETAADLLHRLGDISPERVLIRPAPGTATVEDVIELNERHESLYELVDRTIVEKGVGFRHSLYGSFFVQVLGNFVHERKLGVITGPDGPMQFSGQVRLPDIAFISWGRLPGRKIPSVAVPELAPDLAVEILSPCNTKREMARKRGEYFGAGVRVVWEVDPETRSVAVFKDALNFETFKEGQSIDAAPVLPGFVLSVTELFSEIQ